MSNSAHREEGLSNPGAKPGASKVRLERQRLFLDADGVLADFDLSARRLLGATPKEYIAKHGRGAFWKRLAAAKNFYGSLPEMPDARRLFDAGWLKRRRDSRALALGPDGRAGLRGLGIDWDQLAR